MGDDVVLVSVERSATSGNWFCNLASLIRSLLSGGHEFSADFTILCTVTSASMVYVLHVAVVKQFLLAI
jgi:hypothetical protein